MKNQKFIIALKKLLLFLTPAIVSLSKWYLDKKGYVVIKKNKD